MEYEGNFRFLSIKIIKQISTLDLDMKCEDKDIQNHLDTINFPKFSKEQIKTIEDQLLGKENTSDILFSNNFTFPFRPELIELATKSQILAETNQNLQFTIIYYSFISWIQVISRNNSIEFSKLLLESFFCYPEGDTFTEISILSFYATFMFTLKCGFSNTEELKAFLDILLRFIEKQGTSFNIIYKLIPMTIKIINSKYDATLSPSFIKRVLEIKEKKDNIPNDVISEIFFVSKENIKKIDKETINVLNKAINIISDDSLINAMEVFFSNFEAVLSNREKFILTDKPDEKVTVFSKTHTFNVVADVVKHKTLPEDLKITKEITFPETKSFYEILPREMIDFVSPIINIATKNDKAKEEIAKQGKELFANLSGNEEIWMECCALFMFIYSQVYPDFENKLSVDLIVNTFLFQPLVTVFNITEGYDGINSMRNFSIKTIVSYGCDAITRLLGKFIRYPLIQAEIIYRFAEYYDQITMDEKSIPVISRIIFSLMFYYQSFDEELEDKKSTINKVRMALFYLIEKFFSNEKIFLQLMDEQNFIDPFLILSYEAPVRSYIIDNVKKVLDSVDYDKMEVFKEALNLRTHEVLQNIGLDGVVDIGVDIINTINENPICIAFYEDICKSLLLLPKGEKSEQFILGSIDALIYYSKEAVINYTELAALEASIRHVFGEPTEAVVVKIVELLAGQHFKDIQPTFIVKQPKVFRTITEIFKETKHLSMIFNFIANLCKFSSLNCAIAETGGLTTMLIDLISKWITNESVDMELIETALRLLTIISKKACSAPTTRAIISLLCPIEGRTVPRTQKVALRFINNMLKDSKKKPRDGIPFIPDGTFSTKTLMTPSFHLVFWLFSPTDESKGRMTIIDIGELKISLNNGKIGIGDKEEEIKLNKNMWNFISVEAKDSKFTVKVNEDNEISLEASKRYKFNEKTIISIGGAEEKDEESLLGPLAIFNSLTKEELKELKKRSMREDIYSDKCLLSMKPYECDGFINVESNCSITKSKVPCSPFVSFGDILVDKCGIDILLPLFVQWDLPMQDGSENNLSDSVMDIFTNAFEISVEAQKQFNSAGGFMILAHLLKSMNQSHLTFELYRKFYNILTILVYKKAKKSLIKNILMNLNLWIKCTAADHLQIVSHWSKVLVKRNFELIKEIISFEDIISVLVTCYYYEEIEDCGKVIKERVRGEKLNVVECRKYIFEILLEIASFSFTDDDFKLLISTILTCEDTSQSLDFLDFMQTIMGHEEIIGKCSDLSNYVELLIFLFNMKSDEIVVAALSVLITAHNQKLMTQITLRNNVQIMMHLVGSYFSRPSLFERFLQFTSRVPEIFPIVSMMALNSNKVKEMVTKLQPFSRLVSGELAIFWPMIAAYKSDETTRKQVIAFLLKCDPSSFTKIMATAEVVGLVMKLNTHKMEKLILKEASKYNEIQDEFINICQHFILYQEKDKLILIRGMYEDSVYFDDDDDETSEESEKSSTFGDQIFKKKVDRFARHSFQLSKYKSRKNECSYTPEAAEDALSIFFPINEPKGKLSKSRRFSLLSISGTRRQSKLVSPEGIDTVFTPKEFDMKVNHFGDREFVYSFGIKFNDYGNWEDEDIAKIYIDKVIENSIPITKYSETIAGLLTSSCDYDTKDYFKNSAYVKKCKGSKDDLSNQVLIEAFEFLEDVSVAFDTKVIKEALLLLKYYVKTNVSNAAVAAETLLLTSTIAPVSSNCIANFVDNVSQNLSQSSRIWSHLWQCLCINNAPWSKSLPPGHSSTHYKRDMTITGFVPLKLRKNYSFNDHIHDSLMRDTGDEGTTQRELENYKKSLSEEYAIHAPTALLDVVEDHSSEKKDIDIGKKSCIAEISCELISITKKREGVLAILTDSLVINMENKVKIINLCDIRDIYLRTNLHHPTAIEIFLTNGKNYLVNFPKIAALTVLKHFRRLSIPNLRDLQTTGFKQYFEAQKFTEAWSNRDLSNFDYLMLLNKFSGRTFNDASQYPFMPWILSDYKSESIDLNDSSVYRDLSKPIGALNKERLDELNSKMDSFIEMGMTPYLFSSGTISPLSLYLWLVREEPFTTLHTEIQSGRFDHPARLFSSIPNAWSLATTTQNDFRELIPEFFSSPEFLLNVNHFDLGSYGGRKIDDVVLPKWASNPYDFVYTHRKAIESDYVSEHINEWIDLVWGYKQKGEEAAEANNIYRPEMYPDIWTDENLSDPEVRAGIEAILCHIGQVPQQLFTAPHVKRNKHVPGECCITQPLIVNLNAQNIITGIIRGRIDSKYSISVLDSNGMISIITYNMELLTKVSKNAAKKHKIKNNTQKVISIGSAQNAKKPQEEDEQIMDTLEVDNSHDLKAKTKIIKDFCSCCMPQEQVVSTFLRGRRLLITGKLSNELYIVNSESATISAALQERSRIVCADSNRSIACIANSEAILSFYNTSDFSTPLFMIPSFASAVKCVAVSERFHLAVCGTRDCSLILSSLTDQQVTKIVNLDGCRPVSCLITHEWGFICVHAAKLVGGFLKNMMILLSPNGDIINKIDLESGVSCWCSATTKSGFDYIFMVDEEGNFFAFEAFYLEIGKRIYSTTENIVSVKILCRENLGIAITENGKVLFLPIQID